MSQNDFDDGLVHSHGWACSDRGRLVNRLPVEALSPAKPEEFFDDGLVHSHGWACGERGQAAHRG